MTLYRIYAKKLASRRYQVTFSLRDPSCMQPAYVNNIESARKIPEMAVLSPRPYPKGCIVNPTKIIKELIKECARHE